MKQIQTSVEKKRQAYQQKDEELSELRKKIANQNSDIVEYSAKQRKLNSCIEKLSTSSMLTRLKLKNYTLCFLLMIQLFMLHTTTVT